MLGHRYKVDSVKEYSLSLLHSNVQVHNAAQVAILAHKHKEEELESAALEVIKNNFAKVKITKGWAAIERDPTEPSRFHPRLHQGSNSIRERGLCDNKPGLRPVNWE